MMGRNKPHRPVAADEMHDPGEPPVELIGASEHTLGDVRNPAAAGASY